MKPSLVILLLLVLGAFQGNAEEVLLQSDGIVLVTDLLPGDATKYVTEFQAMKQLFESRGLVVSPIPTIVFLFQTERKANAMFPEVARSAHAIGLTLSSEDQAFVIYSVDAKEGMRGFRHEVSHALLRAVNWKLSDWIDEGAAEYFSTAVFQPESVFLGGSPRIGSRERCAQTPNMFAKVPLRSRNESFYETAWIMAKHLIESRPLSDALREPIATQRVCVDASGRGYAFRPAPAQPVSIRQSIDEITALKEDFQLHRVMAESGVSPARNTKVATGTIPDLWSQAFLLFTQGRYEELRSMLAQGKGTSRDPRLQFYARKLSVSDLGD